MRVNMGGVGFVNPFQSSILAHALAWKLKKIRSTCRCVIVLMLRTYRQLGYSATCWKFDHISVFSLARGKSK